MAKKPEPPPKSEFGVDKFTQPAIGIIILKPGIKPDVVPVENYPVVVDKKDDPNAL